MSSEYRRRQIARRHRRSFTCITIYHLDEDERDVFMRQLEDAGHIVDLEDSGDYWGYYPGPGEAVDVDGE